MSTYIVITIPFIFSGICVCLALTRYPVQVGRLYAADLAGAALGCIAVVTMLEILDGPTLVFVVAMLAASAAAWFAGGLRLRRISVAISLLLLLLAGANTFAAQHGGAFIRLWWVKGNWEQPALYERWNSFSRIRVEKDVITKPAGWGLSSTYPPERKVEQLYLNIDANAGTFLTRFTGDLSAVDFLKYDVTNVAHYLRPDSHVLVVGTGGGRDVLSALVFQQPKITGVEINGQIINAVTRRFADFTGHLDRIPGVRFVNDEARSYIARSPERFDIIQISLIDTWAATAAGAYVLSENALYTTDAWDIFLGHLTPRGVFSVSRWYYNNRPGETWRLVSLANATLSKQGITDPLRHMLIIKCPVSEYQADGDLPDAVATMLISPTPFSDADLANIEAVARQMRFDIVLGPNTASGPLKELAQTHDLAATVAKMPLNLMPPTDNQPFFFNMARFRDILKADTWRSNDFRVNLTAVGVLGGLLVCVSILAGAFIVIPVAMRSQLSEVRKQLPLSAYFLAIGFAFMLVEISQMQRLVVLLGHPTYSLSVVLFTLLLSSGLGSLSTSSSGGTARSALARLALLLVVLGVLGLVTPALVKSFQASTTPIRIALSIALLAPAGFFMGMAFPLGMKISAHRGGQISAWLWAINGAASIVASVLAIVLAMAFGISTAWWTGVAFYAAAALLTWAIARQTASLASPSTNGAKHLSPGVK